MPSQSSTALRLVSSALLAPATVTSARKAGKVGLFLLRKQARGARRETRDIFGAIKYEQGRLFPQVFGYPAALPFCTHVGEPQAQNSGANLVN